jgi:hypothetical protein
LHEDNQGYWTLEDLTSFTIASGAVVFLTQVIQKITGWEPIWVGLVLSLGFAALSIPYMPSHQWMDVVVNLGVRAFQLYFYCGGAVGFVHTLVRRHRRRPAVEEAETKREFWKPWF